jgi:hypothetical protein
MFVYIVFCATHTPSCALQREISTEKYGSPPPRLLRRRQPDGCEKEERRKEGRRQKRRREEERLQILSEEGLVEEVFREVPLGEEGFAPGEKGLASREEVFCQSFARRKQGSQRCQAPEREEEQREEEQRQEEHREAQHRTSLGEPLRLRG